MDDKEINAYKDGFIAGIDLKDNRFIGTLFGLPIKEVLDIVAKYIKDNNKEMIIEVTDEKRVIIKRYGMEIYRVELPRDR